jgi:hypothetical protein
MSLDPAVAIAGLLLRVISFEWVRCFAPEKGSLYVPEVSPDTDLARAVPVVTLPKSRLALLLFVKSGIH